MKAGFLQWDLQWENPSLNKAHVSSFLSGNTAPDLLILPEMFSTGFSMNASAQAESMSGHTIQFLKDNASSYNTVIAGSLIIEENSSFFNRFVFVFPDGRLIHYDKHHLFTLSGEDQTYTAGKSIPTISLAGWKICPQVCYDLRFPEWARSALPFDMLIYTASWPEKRIEAWSSLLKARAIENQCYVIGVNRIGTDGNGLVYNGKSTVIQYDGEVLLNAGNREGYYEIELNFDAQTAYRSSLPFLADKDSITIG